jgi:outer membrane lipoprotein SlyB
MGKYMRKQIAVAVIVMSMLSGCAPAPYRPIVDNGTPQGNYDGDLEDCQRLANNVQPANNVVAGAVAGALLGALLGRAIGLNGSQTGNVAAWGAASGGVQGLAAGSAQWTGVVNRCMVGRGYNVVG